MNEPFNLTAEITIFSDTRGLEKRVLESFLTALQLTDLLYMLGRTECSLESTERLLFNKLIDTLESSSEDLEEITRKHILEQIESLKKSDYDMGSITYVSRKNPDLELLFGKVVSPEHENKKLYGAAVGFVNRELQSFVESFDKLSEKLYENSALPGCSAEKKFSEIKSEFRCMDVLRLAGELNRKNKPISVFYSGRPFKKIASLPKVAVFSNVYMERYKAVSCSLGEKLIDNYKTPDDKQLLRILVAWLRGHDLGHVFGENNLGAKMRSHRAEYYILHELKSDIMSLILLNRTVKDLFCQDIMDEICDVFVSEMFRYLRKGEFSKFPDSGSAYFAFRYFSENRALNRDNTTGMFSVNTCRMGECSEKLSVELFEIFEKGSLQNALSFVNRYGDITETGADQIYEMVPDLFDKKIPLNTEFEFKFRT